MRVFYSYAIDNYGVLTLYKHTAQGVYSVCDISDCNDMDNDRIEMLVDDLIAEHEENLKEF